MKIVFYPTCVGKAAHTVFSLEIASQVALAPPNEETSSNETASETVEKGCFLICADDDKGPRLSYKGLVNKLGADNSLILGETYEEAEGLVQTVLETARKHGDHNVICIFDQNMDRYPEGTVLGTNVTKELRERGFRGLIFIRSANDDMASMVQYKTAGADATLTKSVPSMNDLVKAIMKVYRQFLLTGMLTCVQTGHLNEDGRENFQVEMEISGKFLEIKTTE